jgi:nicotinamide mononucleotide (NMN) deamidase PncC
MTVWRAGGAAARGLPQSIGCNYRGILNKTTQRCTCMSGWAGPDCSQKLCEVGYAWVDLPTADDTAHGRWVLCRREGVHSEDEETARDLRACVRLQRLGAC